MPIFPPPILSPHLFLVASLLWLAASTGGAVAGGATVAPAAVRVVGDSIPEPLTTESADAARGRAIVLDRANGNCLICHRVPEPAEAFQGDLGPDLAGIGARLDAPRLRLRLVDQTRINPATLMPPFYRTEGLVRVGRQYRGIPVLSALEIEDVIAYLLTLKE